MLPKAVRAWAGRGVPVRSYSHKKQNEPTTTKNPTNNNKEGHGLKAPWLPSSPAFLFPAGSSHWPNPTRGQSARELRWWCCHRGRPPDMEHTEKGREWGGGWAKGENPAQLVTKMSSIMVTLSNYAYIRSKRRRGVGWGEAHVQTIKKNRHWQQLAWQSFLITWANKVGFLAWLTTKEFIFGLESRMVLITDSSNYVLLVLIRRFASSSKYHLIDQWPLV